MNRQNNVSSEEPRDLRVEADQDPGCPTPTDLKETGTLELARTLANYGMVEPGTSVPPPEILAVEEVGDVPVGSSLLARTLPVDIVLVQQFLRECIAAGVGYGPRAGAKVPFHGATPGKDFRRVDCSGFVREAIWRGTAPHFEIIDGSVRQHDWIRQQGFAKTTSEDARRQDNAIRIAFLRPQDSRSGIGHVALVHRAQTIESHGGKGPDHREWISAGWQAKAFLYILTENTSPS